MHRLGAPFMASWRGYLGEGGEWKTDAACIILPGYGFILCLFYHPLPEQAINVSKMLPIIVLNNAYSMPSKIFAFCNTCGYNLMPMIVSQFSNPI